MGRLLGTAVVAVANPTIGRQLEITEKTVRNNVSAILSKLRVADRAQAIIAARDAGLGT